jgi:hypothetical protein
MGVDAFYSTSTCVGSTNGTEASTPEATPDPSVGAGSFFFFFFFFFFF